MTTSDATSTATDTDGSAIADAVHRVFDPAWKHDPYSSYAVLRAAGPFIPGPFGLQLVSRYAEIDEIMQDPTWSHAEEAKLLHPQSDGSDLPASFLWMEPPDHTRLRRLVSKAFTARRVDGLRERVTEVTRVLLDEVIDAGEVDWVEKVAYPLPLTMITEMLGVPTEAHDLVRSMSYGIARGLDPDTMLSPQELENRRTSATAFKDYFGELVVERKAHPKDDLISDLARVEAEGERLSTDEMLSTLVVLVVAGHETTVNLIGNGLLALARDPDEYAALCADPDLAGPAVDELMRYDGPSHFTTREATRDVEVSGHRFATGDGVIILLASGNRDARAYSEPDRLDLARYAGRGAVPRHLGFGVGHHYCIGSPLVRVEMDVVLRTLAERRPRLELLADPPPYRPNLVVRGLQALPIALHSAPSA
jgi:cytochrome P450